MKTITFASLSACAIASWTTDPTLPSHVIYAPTNPPATLKLPVLVWGQTGCTYNGRVFDAFLTEVASHGILILSNGTPNGASNPNGIAETQNPNTTLHRTAMDWVTKNAGTGKYAGVDASRLAVAGQSCGGMQALFVSPDPRVTAIGIFNSGVINAADPLPSKTTKPIFYFLGGPTDIAYTNGERDYTVLPASTPKWKGNLAVGHMGTFSQANGGKFGVAGSNWAKWLLRGNVTAAAYFTGSGPGTAQGDGWATVSQTLDGIKVASLD
ncbi:hypothetical protein B0T14DRAFT_594434 [Immersiella caudata]|uniref:Uncharacterized protein n=1 Tax=Immersiella caudata TaxID=314043 RepID=A0AA39WCT0_9PEZI|nr:hypothetical protein B0T14DRAFT_594434 [Immersiella caudata]